MRFYVTSWKKEKRNWETSEGNIMNFIIFGNVQFFDLLQCKQPCICLHVLSLFRRFSIDSWHGSGQRNAAHPEPCWSDCGWFAERFSIWIHIFMFSFSLVRFASPPDRTSHFYRVARWTVGLTFEIQPHRDAQELANAAFNETASYK